MSIFKKMYEGLGFTCEDEDFVLAEKDIADMGTAFLAMLTEEQQEQYLKIKSAYDDAREVERECMFTFAYKLGVKTTAASLT